MFGQRLPTAVAIATAVLVAVGTLFLSSSSTRSDTRTIEDRSVFFRLITKYQHGDEVIDFNIVVGCAVRVTRWGDGDKSYDAFRDPAAYVKPTRDGAAVLQMVPSACRGETTANHEVPDDFLPGALWFDRADDLSFGIAYVTEDAFESPRSKLKFLGAKIVPATREEYIAFEPIAAKNLMDPRPLFAFLPLPSVEEFRKHLGDSRALTRIWPGLGCDAVLRLHLTDPAERAIIAEYWPDSKPRYWMPTKQQLEEIRKRIGIYTEVTVDGRDAKAYSKLNYNTANGFPTRAQGGTIGSRHKPWDKLPPTVFPIRRDEGIPWATREYQTANKLYRDIVLDGGDMRGFAYCYAWVPGQYLGVPAYLNGNFETRVDGEPIFGEASDTRMPRDRPWPFFERDEYFYRQDSFGLN
jgi:hypothetical protein